MSACNACKLHGAQTDWAGANYQHIFAGAYTCPAHAMCTDSQRFNKRQLVKTQSFTMNKRRLGITNERSFYYTIPASATQAA
jgi:hypothetical protein